MVELICTCRMFSPLPISYAHFIFPQMSVPLPCASTVLTITPPYSANSKSDLPRSCGKLCTSVQDALVTSVRENDNDAGGHQSPIPRKAELIPLKFGCAPEQQPGLSRGELRQSVTMAAAARSTANRPGTCVGGNSSNDQPCDSTKIICDPVSCPKQSWSTLCH